MITLWADVRGWMSNVRFNNSHGRVNYEADAILRFWVSADDVFGNA